MSLKQKLQYLRDKIGKVGHSMHDALDRTGDIVETAIPMLAAIGLGRYTAMAGAALGVIQTVDLLADQIDGVVTAEAEEKGDDPAEALAASPLKGQAKLEFAASTLRGLLAKSGLRCPGDLEARQLIQTVFDAAIK